MVSECPLEANANIAVAKYVDKVVVEMEGAHPGRRLAPNDTLVDMLMIRWKLYLKDGEEFTFFTNAQ